MTDRAGTPARPGVRDRLVAGAEALDARLGRAEAVLGVCLLLALVAVMSVQVASRQIPALSAPWSEEAARFLFAWLAFTGTALAVQRSAHIAITAAVDRLGAGTRRGIEVVVRLLVMVFAALMVWYGVRLCLSTALVSTVMRIPMWVPYAAIPLSGALVLVHAAVGIVKVVAGPSGSGAR